MVTEEGGQRQPGPAIYPPPRTPKCYMQARCMTGGCPGGSRWGEDSRTRAGRHAETLGRGQKLGHLGGGAGSAQRAVPCDPAAGSMPGGVRRRQAPGTGRAGLPCSLGSCGPSWGLRAWPRNVSLGMFEKAGARGFRGQPSGACAQMGMCERSPAGPGPHGPRPPRAGHLEPVRAQGRPGTVTLAEAEALLGQRPRRMGRRCWPETCSSLLEGERGPEAWVVPFINLYLRPRIHFVCQTKNCSSRSCPQRSRLLH